MSGALQAVFMNHRSFGAPTPGAIGSAYQGGFYAGEISVAGNGIASHYLVVSPLSSGESSSLQMRNSNSSIVGADSVIDGPQNTADMIAAGNSTAFPAAHFCNDASIGGYTDWYLPAKNELELCYYNLKPSTPQNETFSGANTNAVPSRASNYTTTVPAQTSVTAFKILGAEAFSNATYWTSTESSSSEGWVQYFRTGAQYGRSKSTFNRVRCVRREAI